MKSRLKKVALMPVNMFQNQLDQISDKGRDVLKAIEDYKFFLDQVARIVKNDPGLAQTIVGKKKNLDNAANQIYDVVFDIENMDIISLYDRQEEGVEQNQKPNDNKPNIPHNEDKLVDQKKEQEKSKNPVPAIPRPKGAPIDDKPIPNGSNDDQAYEDQKKMVQ